MTEKEYHAMTDVVSSTHLKKIISSSPLHFLYEINNPKEPTPAMILGQYLHAICLEPEKINDNFSVYEKIDRRTKEGKQAFAEFESKSIGKTIITDDQVNLALNMKASLDSHKIASNLLKIDGSIIEQMFFWTDEKTELKCRIKPDLINGSKLIDIKTTMCAAPFEFASQSARLNYHLQLAFYKDGFEKVTGQKIDECLIVAVETAPPHAVVVYKIDDESLEQGRRDYRKGLNILKDCYKKNNFYGYSDEILSLKLPSYKIYQPDEDQTNNLPW